MRRLYGAVTGVSALALLVSLGAPWWTVTLEGGAVIPVQGLDASPLASSLLAVGVAAFGLGLLVRGTWRRVVSVLQAVAALGAGYAIISLGARPEVAVASDIATLTGIAGSSAMDLVVQTEGTSFLWLAGAGLAAAVASGLVGAVMPDKPARTDRYQRSSGAADPKDSIAAWDHLSEGSDPTTR